MPLVVFSSVLSALNPGIQNTGASTTHVSTSSLSSRQCHYIARHFKVSHPPLRRSDKVMRVMAQTVSGLRPRASAIERKLREAFQPAVLNIVDESHLHAGHSGNPSGDPSAETHFKVEVVSTDFEGKSLVQRHKSIYALLDDELNSGLHALSLKVKTPKEAGL